MQNWKVHLIAFLIMSLSLSACTPEDFLDTADTVSTDTVSTDTEEATAFTSLYEGYLQDCALCHAADAPGITSDTEQTLDFSSADTAYSSLMGSASGLVGNQAGCNGVKFVMSGKPSSSLLVAVLVEDVRQGFDLASNPDCNVDSISDMTVKVGSIPDDAFLNSLKDWITDGAAQ